MTIMRFNPKALLVFVAFFLFLAIALSSGSDWKAAEEAVAGVLVAAASWGFMRDRRRTR